MSDFIESIKGEPVISAMVFAPFLLFVSLIIAPSLDKLLLPSPQIQQYLHYYAAAFSGFVALIIALYSSGVFGQEIRVRMQFITLAFSLLAGLLLLSGLTTPHLLLGDGSANVSNWSFALSLPVGAVFFALAGVRWRPQLEMKLARRRAWLWVGAVGLFVGCVWLVTAVPLPAPAVSPNPIVRLAGLGLALATIVLYAWAASRIRIDFESKYTFSHRLSGTLLLLAEAEFFLIAGRSDGMSGLLVYPLLLLALLVAVWAILSTLRGAENLQVSRYFAAAGSVLIIGVSLLLGEFVINVFSLEDHRLAILSALLFESVLGFLILYVIVVHLDRLVRLRTEDFRREQRLRTELTQMVIHDLKSPLSVIRSSIGMLLKGYLGDITPRQQRVLVRADESNQRILQLIDNLLDVERMEAGALPLHMRDIESVHWLRESLAHWEVVAEAQGKTLLLNIPEALPSLYGDRELLHRVVNNLLTNALHYASPEGKVEVTAVYQHPHIVLAIADDGPGVPDNEKLRIFEKFAQVESLQHRGTGLGLTFCRMMVEAHSGTLVVEDNPTGGAVFRLALPINLEHDSWPVEENSLTAVGRWSPAVLPVAAPLSADDR
ncbi:MAG: hypothetical protein H6659_12100 [Ardenticatenaceae bacterium]|nr:hypothetical protein [Ardenticatenaceae bacterium]MCB8986136.1 hypothetical protein [Ardenticatenaceae bacterium]